MKEKTETVIAIMLIPAVFALAGITEIFKLIKPEYCMPNRTQDKSKNRTGNRKRNSCRG